jgi:hypothetical protein
MYEYYYLKLCVNLVYHLKLSLFSDILVNSSFSIIFSISLSMFFDLQACHATLGGAAAFPAAPLAVAPLSRHSGWRRRLLCRATGSGAAALSRHSGWRRLGEGERGGEEEVREEVGWGSDVGSF